MFLLVGNRDLFVDSTVKSYGQLVIRIRDDDHRKGDIPDQVLAQVVDHLPTVCLLIGDSKCKSSDEGKNQVFMYIMSLHSKYLCLGLVISNFFYSSSSLFRESFLLLTYVLQVLIQFLK